MRFQDSSAGIKRMCCTNQQHHFIPRSNKKKGLKGEQNVTRLSLTLICIPLFSQALTERKKEHIDDNEESGARGRKRENCPFHVVLDLSLLCALFLNVISLMRY